ncbi:MAG: alpha/beta fold hydrolase [Verrucomicrobia bacterium]|nr:alpha/beta fold hydrolase [Verrucomicrobiota bacterium]
MTLSRDMRTLSICVTLVFFFSGLAAQIQSGFGSVRIRGVVLPTQNGQWVAADLFRPLRASQESPAPVVVVVPGFQRSKETQANLSLELARRGMVVLAIDPYAQGFSSSSLSTRSATEEGYGMFAVVHYLADTGNLNYIDPQRIGVTGHSAGGNAAIQAAAHFGEEAVAKGTRSKIHSAFISGYLLSLRNKVLRSVRSNLGLSYALFDEGAFRNENKSADLRQAPESLRFVRSGQLSGEPEVSDVEINRYYGDPAARNLRVVFNEPLLHAFQPYSPKDLAHQIGFFLKVFDLPAAIAPEEQIWPWKELFSLVSFAASLVALIPFTRLVLFQVPYFRLLVHPIPEAPARPQGRAQLVFWILFLTGAVFACLSYIPLTELSQKLFPEATSRQATWFFPQRMNNGVMLWALANGLFGFGLFFLGLFLQGKKFGLPALGLDVSPRETWRALILATTTFLFFYGLLFVVYQLFHVDYRFLFLGVRLFQPELLLLMTVYAPAFLVFFFSNSVRANLALRFSGTPPWRNLLLAGVGNSLGLFLILIIQYLSLALTGTVRWTEGWLYVNLLFAVAPTMFVLPYFHRYFFEMTGRTLLGPLITCLIFLMILLSNTVCYLPL